MSASADILYKQLFAHPEIVRDLVAGFLAADWAPALPVRAFERVNASYASDQGRARHEDVVWRAHIGGDWVYVYILLEFQSRPDKWMALRMQVYVGLLYQDLVAQHKLSKHGKLPPVLPIVLYDGSRPWRAATRLAELMLPAPAGLEHFQASQQYLLIDRHHAGNRANIVSLLFRLLSAVTDAEMRGALDAVAERIRERDLDPARESLTRWIQITLQDAVVATSMDLEEAFTMKMRRKFTYDEMFDPGMFERPIAKARAQAIVEGLQQGREQGLEEGLEQGLEQGLEAGRQQGERLALQRVLRRRLSQEHMPTNVAVKIAAANPEQLTDWIEALFNGASPRQLFAGDQAD
ncbi:transposase [Duganella sp. FT50W]|uniref:Transposase n=2 Tax=Duganella lactea TaxID=2692173 RepID=A0A6L8MQ37_9BURK|nr:transposase [Duganella lactea]